VKDASVVMNNWMQLNALHHALEWLCFDESSLNPFMVD
jgi:hypothetical protein